MDFRTAYKFVPHGASSVSTIFGIYRVYYKAIVTVAER